jgi:hypothetical protein
MTAPAQSAMASRQSDRSSQTCVAMCIFTATGMTCFATSILPRTQVHTSVHSFVLTALLRCARNETCRAEHMPAVTLAMFRKISDLRAKMGDYQVSFLTFVSIFPFLCSFDVPLFLVLSLLLYFMGQCDVSPVLCCLQVHRDAVDHQRAKFKASLDALQPGQLIIIKDFGAKFTSPWRFNKYQSDIMKPEKYTYALLALVS